MTISGRTGYPGVPDGGGAGGEQAEQAGLAELAELGEVGGWVVVARSMNADHARIRTFFRSLSGRSQCSWHQ